MKLVETKGTIAEDGSIILVPGVLETMGMQPGDSMFLTHLADKSVKAANTYHQVLLTKTGIEEMTEPVEPADLPELAIPHLLLEVAGIPTDGELDIQCLPGVILISSADPLEAVPPELMKLFDALEVDHDTIRAVLREEEFNGK